MKFNTTTSSTIETECIGQKIGAKLKGGEVVELISDLGGGKTTITKGIVEGTGSKDMVASPSFTISYLYSCKNFNIHHFDFYRLVDPGVVKLSIAEAVEMGSDIIIVEWGDIVSDALPLNRVTIKLTSLEDDPDKRQIEINIPDELSYLAEVLK